MAVTIFTRNSVHCFAEVSVCPAVTPLSPIKTVQARITKSSLFAATRTLVFRDKISCPWDDFQLPK